MRDSGVRDTKTRKQIIVKEKHKEEEEEEEEEGPIGIQGFILLYTNREFLKKILNFQNFKSFENRINCTR